MGKHIEKAGTLRPLKIIKRLMCRFAFITCCLLPWLSLQAFATDPFGDLSVPLTSAGESASSLAELEAALAQVRPKKGQPPTVLNAPGHPYILMGDLLGTGTSYALVELQGDKAGLGFAQWTGEKWEPQGLWSIHSAWRPAGWKSSGEDYLPITPATQPFWLLPLGGGAAPEVVVVGAVSKYWQEFYVLHFDPKSKSLHVVGASMAAPYLNGKFVILPYGSGHRSVYEGWQFMRWSEGKLLLAASWQEGVNEHDTDPRFQDGEIDEAIRVGPDGREQEFVIKYFTDDKDRNACEISHERKLFATVSVEWTEKPADIENADARFRAELFHRLTGLPEDRYPRWQGKKPSGALGKIAHFNVAGGPDAMKILASP